LGDYINTGRVLYMFSIVVRGGIQGGGILLFCGVLFENPIILSQHGEYRDA